MNRPTDTVADEREVCANKFVQILIGLRPDRESKDRQAVAELRGLLHGQPRDYFRAGKHVIPYLPHGYLSRRSPDEKFTEECFFQIAALYALAEGVVGNERGINFGAALKHLRDSAHGNESLDGRFLTLLSADADTYFSHLRQMVTLLRSAGGIKLDWTLLLIESLRWNLEAKPIQFRWAKAYYRTSLQQANVEQPTVIPSLDEN